MFKDQWAGSSVHCGGWGIAWKASHWEMGSGSLRNESSGSCQSWSLGSTFINGPFRSVWTKNEKIWLGFTPSSVVERMDSSFYILKAYNNNNFLILSSNRWLIFLPSERDDALQSPKEIHLFPASFWAEKVSESSALWLFCSTEEWSREWRTFCFYRIHSWIIWSAGVGQACGGGWIISNKRREKRRGQERSLWT